MLERIASALNLLGAFCGMRDISALTSENLFEKYGVKDIVISAKASDTMLTVKAYRYLASKTNYPLHIGVTEAGTYENGIIKSSVGIGALLVDGIGDTLRVSLTANPVFEPMIVTSTVLKDNMLTAAKKGFINATDLADYLVKKGMPFRSAYKLVGETVAYCIANGTVLEDLPFEKYTELSDLFEEDVYNEISLETCVNKRISAGSTGPESVNAQIEYITEFLNND